MSLKTQAKVLRVLQEQTFERVGGTEIITVDVRVIAASNKPLEEEIQKGTFREDLFYRLNVIPFEIPPLRARSEDIPLLANYFLLLFSQEYGKRKKTLSPAAMDLLLQHPWPGNVRELRNVMERMVIMVPGDMIQETDVAPSLRVRLGAASEAAAEPEVSWDGPLREARERFERQYILCRLKEAHWNISRTADRLGIERSNLHRKMKAYGIEPPRA
jgi:two-component system nitrogen regulation response regulator NtrX